MDDPVDLALKNKILQALEKCTDTDLLDLIHRLLIYYIDEK